jgi:hypothetical protein
VSYQFIDLSISGFLDQSPYTTIYDSLGTISPNPSSLYENLSVSEGEYRMSPTLFSSNEFLDSSWNYTVSLEVTAVPIPAAAWLFGSALLGLGVVKRKKRRLI